MEIKLSIVIITYNMAKFLPTALRSLKKQTCQDFEVIIVDNHSTDHTEEVIKSFTTLNISCFKIYNEGILSKSRNMGLEKAKGEWVAFLDADDYWREDKVQQLLKCFRNLSDDNYVAITHACVEKDLQTGKKRLLSKDVKCDNLHKNLIIGKNVLCLTGTTVRKKTALKIGGFCEDNELKTVEDYDMWIRLSREGKFYYINKNLATIVLHEGNYSKKADIQMNALDCLKHRYLDVNNTDITEKEKKRAFRDLDKMKARCLQKNGFFKESKAVCISFVKNGHFSLKMMIIFFLAVCKVSR